MPRSTDPPTFAGSLALDVLRGRPRLTLTFRCPACRGLHLHGWGLDATGPAHRTAHCWRESSPYRMPGGYGYYIVPDDTAENRKLLREYKRLLDANAPPPSAPPTTAG